MDSLSSIEEHLQWWGLQPCDTEESYEQWQQTAFSQNELYELRALATRKSASLSVHDEIAFYNYSVHPAILPVLYSQRYQYYRLLGSLLLPWVKVAGSILDVGCGPGILTTYLARTSPDGFFLGIDRSSECIRVAQEQAERLQLRNVRFECLDIQDCSTRESYEVVLSCQALLQSEHDPGIPSQSWNTFARSHDPDVQSAFEKRTGLHARLDRLLSYVQPGGKILLYEKVGHVARRVPFQRALASRGLQLLRGSCGVIYREMNQSIDDGPLYVMMYQGHGVTDNSATDGWDETPTIVKEWNAFKKCGAAAQVMWKRLPDKQVEGRFQGAGQEGREVYVEWGTFSTLFQYFFLTVGAGFQGIVIGIGHRQDTLPPLARHFMTAGQGAPKDLERQIADIWPDVTEDMKPELTPLYENHTIAAQDGWSCFDGAHILREFTKDGEGGRQVHIELGEQGGLLYLYCANTFDQRQLVVIDQERGFLLEEYYQELFEEQIRENSVK